MDSAAPEVAAPSAQSLARGFSWIWSGTIIGQAAWFGSLIVLGMLLPPTAFGAVAIGTFIANAAALVQDAGSRGSIVMTRKLTARDVMRTVSINLAVGIVFAGVVWVTADAIVARFDRGAEALVLQVLIASVAVRALAIAPMAVLQRTMMFKLQGTINASAMLVASTLAVASAFAGAGVWALVIRQFAAAALLPVLAWFAAARPLRRELAAPARDWGPTRRKGAIWFFVLAATDFVALSIDSVVVGHSRGAQELGLYALAFTLAFAPLTNFAWQIGKVVFPAAASTQDTELIARRMLRTTRLTATLLLPLLPPTLLLAPQVLPRLLGPEWQPMVLPFQILVTVGIGHAVLVALGDSLSGIGAIAWRARVHVCWALAMIVALIVLVRLYGIDGAAGAHAVVFAPFAAAYVAGGTTRLGVGSRAFLRSLQEIALLVGVQLVVTLAMQAILAQVTSPLVATILAAGVGCATFALLAARWGRELRGDCSSLSRALLGRRAAGESGAL